MVRGGIKITIGAFALTKWDMNVEAGGYLVYHYGPGESTSSTVNLCSKRYLICHCLLKYLIFRDSTNKWSPF